MRSEVAKRILDRLSMDRRLSVTRYADKLVSLGKTRDLVFNNLKNAYMSKRSQRVFRREFKKSGVNGEFSGELVVMSGLLRRKEGYKDMNHKGAVTTYETQEYHSAQAFIGGNLVREVEFLSSDRHAGYAAVSDMIGFLGDAILSLCNDAVRKTIDADLPEMGFSEIKSNASASSKLKEGPMVIDYSATVGRLQGIDAELSELRKKKESEEPIVARVSDEDFKKALDAEFRRGRQFGFEKALDSLCFGPAPKESAPFVHAVLNIMGLSEEMPGVRQISLSKESVESLLIRSFDTGRVTGFNEGQALGEARLDAYKKSIQQADVAGSEIGIGNVRMSHEVYDKSLKERYDEGFVAGVNFGKVESKNASSYVEAAMGFFKEDPDRGLISFSKEAVKVNLTRAFNAGYTSGRNKEPIFHPKS